MHQYTQPTKQFRIIHGGMKPGEWKPSPGWNADWRNRQYQL